MNFKLTKSGYRVLSTIGSNFSAVFLGSLVIPVFLVKLEVPKVYVLLLGLSLTSISLLLAVKFGEKGKI